MQELSALLRPYSKHSRALRTVRTGVGMCPCLGISLVLVSGRQNPHAALPVLNTFFFQSLVESFRTHTHFLCNQVCGVGVNGL